MSLFGGATSATGTNAFGASQQPQQPASNIFGSFGGNAGTTGAQPTQPAGGSSIFGSTPAGTGSNIFGSTPAQGGTAGATAGGTGTGLFGSAQPAGTNLFGGAAAQPQNAQAGTGLFGGAAAQQQQPNANAPGTGLFGSTAGTGTNIFGGSAQQPAPGNAFGSTLGQPSAPSTAVNQTGGLFGGFGAGAQPQFSAAPTGPQSSLFGSQFPSGPSQPAAQFGASTAGGGLGLGQSGLLGGGFGANSLLSSRPATAPAQTQADAQAQFAQLQQKIEGIMQAWNATSPACRFQHYFYNMVDPNQVHMYGRPPNATDEAAWQRAVRENPDPSCLVPVLAVGFDDLQKRVEAQTQQAAAHQEKLKDLTTRIQALAQRHDMSNASRLQKAAQMQTQITQRILRLVQHLHLLIPALRSSSLRPEEEALRAALEEIEEELRTRAGASRLQGRLGELWALVNSVVASRQGSHPDSRWAVVDEEGLQRIAQVLGDQQAGLSYVTKVLQKDLQDLAVMQGAAVKRDDSDLLSLAASTTGSPFRGSLSS